MNGFQWDEARHVLGNDEMDATHRAFVTLAAHAATADEDVFPAAFDALVAHTREHFGAEEAKMRATHFPATGEHLGEHGRVLAEMQSFQRSVHSGRLRFARTYVRDGLPEWFGLHLRTMDAALAAHLAKCASPPPPRPDRRRGG